MAMLAWRICRNIENTPDIGKRNAAMLYLPSVFKRLKPWFVVLAVLPFSVFAQNWPSKPITLIVTQGPGSGSDVIVRLLAGAMGVALGQNIVVENRTGGSGIIGHQYVARAPADGYTLLFSSTAIMLVVPAIHASAKYSLADFAPAAPVLRAPYAVLVANKPEAPKTLAELIDVLRTKPSAYSSTGPGTMTHLATELLLHKAGVTATHVPYKGSGQSLTDLIGGQVLFSTDSLTAAMSHIRSGKLRALAVTDLAREQSLPDVPTLAESGFPGTRAVIIGGFFAPKGTPESILDRIAAVTAQTMQNPQIAQRFAALETSPLRMSNQEFVEQLRKEDLLWTPVIKQLDLKSE